MEVISNHVRCAAQATHLHLPWANFYFLDKSLCSVHDQNQIEWSHNSPGLHQGQLLFVHIFVFVCKFTNWNWIPQDYIRDNYCPTLGDHQHFCRESLSRYYVGMLVQFPIIFCLFPNLTSLSRYPPCSNVGHFLRCSFSHPNSFVVLHQCEITLHKDKPETVMLSSTSILPQF